MNERVLNIFYSKYIFLQHPSDIRYAPCWSFGKAPLLLS
uniref:Uncharacterized protein n=1 Tax=Arundo donax TaxID=35708 RepID=A0A0A9C1V7_ARUDO